jgi:hypothetical protein
MSCNGFRGRVSQVRILPGPLLYPKLTNDAAKAAFLGGKRHSIPRTGPIKPSRPAENHTPGVSPFYALCVSYSPNILRHQLTRSELF